MGVRAYVCKRSNVQELEKAILSALEGNLYIDDRAETRLQVYNKTGIYSRLELHRL